MGARADFYIGRGKDAEWLGSIAWDGYPSGVDRPGLLDASDESGFRGAVLEEIAGREDGTKPEDGWPWPWDTSDTTDYAYAFDDGRVHGSCFGGNWFDPNGPKDEDGDQIESDVPAAFPDMSSRKNVNFGDRSGVIFIRG